MKPSRTVATGAARKRQRRIRARIDRLAVESRAAAIVHAAGAVAARRNPNTRKRPPPDRVVVSWCPECDHLQSVARPSRKGTLRRVCDRCMVRGGERYVLLVVSYRLDTTRGFQ